MSLTASRRSAAVADDFRDRGFALEDREWGTVTTSTGSTPADVDAPLALTSLENSRPLTVVSAIANAADEGFVPVLVADQHTADAVQPILSPPFLLADREGKGRSFLTIEDRIRLQDDTYACVGASGELAWFEDFGTGTDAPPLVLAVGGEIVTVFDSVDRLACPGPAASAFQYSYGRGGDGQFRVFADGEAVGRYTSVAAMRSDGFRPVPLPLVPEHHVRTHGQLARATVVATAADGSQTVTYRSVT